MSLLANIVAGATLTQWWTNAMFITKLLVVSVPVAVVYDWFVNSEGGPNEQPYTLFDLAATFGLAWVLMGVVG